ncbi:hypothetical protein QE152_g10896 [Popillia japonica]|uniref:Uncharacterized protein n=1 Tax=Popillia japonica TaxID=7064 RepID=A0AAW1LUY1_POPJA
MGRDPKWGRVAKFWGRERFYFYFLLSITHCLIHREALAAKKLAPELNDVLQDAVKIINFIKSHALNSRLFSNLCKDTDSNYTTLLLHAEVLSDIFAKLNDLNLSLQGKNCDIFTSNDKIESFIKKINIWKSMVEKNSFEMFSSVDNVIIEKNSFEMFSSVDNVIIEKNDCKTFIAKIIVDHLKALETQFRTYFILNIDFKKVA